MPNIVLLITHDTGRHVSPYGIDTVVTPNCERLAADSVLFENSFCTAPQCSPSRASIVTGRYPHANGTMGLAHADYAWSLHEQERPVAKLLKEADYATWLLGGQHETADPATLGFDHIDLGFTLLDLPDHLKPMLNKHCNARPFYCQIGCFETHRPFDGHGTEPDESRGIHVPRYLSDGPETRDELRKLQGMIRRFDNGLGQLLDILETPALRENTILIVTTDHGLALPMAKGTLFDPGIETMLFARFPGRWQEGERRQELVSNVDLLPTMLETAGVPLPEGLHGQSLLPLMEGKPFTERDHVFAELTFHDCYDPMRCIRTRRHKYIRYFEKSALHTIPGDIIGGGANRELGPLPRHGMEALYDLRNDPWETSDLVNRTGYGNVLDDLRTRLYEWMVETDDPLLRGPIPSPFYVKNIGELTIAKHPSGEQGVARRRPSAAPDLCRFAAEDN